MLLTNTTHQSFIEIGDYSEQYMKNPDKMIWFRDL